MAKNDDFHEGGKVGRTNATTVKLFSVDLHDLKTMPFKLSNDIFITFEMPRSSYIIDVLWGQPIKLIQVASTSELHENDLFSLKLFPVIAAGPQKYKHKIGHNYFTF